MRTITTITLCILCCSSYAQDLMGVQAAVKKSVLDKAQDKAAIQDKVKPFRFKWRGAANTNALAAWDVLQDFNENYTNAAGEVYGVLRLTRADTDGRSRWAYDGEDGTFSATNIARFKAFLDFKDKGYIALYTNSQDITLLNEWGIYYAGDDEP